MSLRRCTELGLFGFVLGLLVVVIGGVSGMSPRHTDMTAVIGGVIAMTGAMACAVAFSVHSNQATRRPVAQVWAEGHETGFSQGWRECAQQYVRPVSGLEQRRQLRGGTRDHLVP